MESTEILGAAEISVLKSPCNVNVTSPLGEKCLGMTSGSGRSAGLVDGLERLEGQRLQQMCQRVLEQNAKQQITSLRGGADH